MDDLPTEILNAILSDCNPEEMPSIRLVNKRLAVLGAAFIFEHVTLMNFRYSWRRLELIWEKYGHCVKRMTVITDYVTANRGIIPFFSFYGSVRAWISLLRLEREQNKFTGIQMRFPLLEKVDFISLAQERLTAYGTYSDDGINDDFFERISRIKSLIANYLLSIRQAIKMDFAEPSVSTLRWLVRNGFARVSPDFEMQLSMLVMSCLHGGLRCLEFDTHCGEITTGLDRLCIIKPLMESPNYPRILQDIRVCDLVELNLNVTDGEAAYDGPQFVMTLGSWPRLKVLDITAHIWSKDMISFLQSHELMILRLRHCSFDNVKSVLEVIPKLGLMRIHLEFLYDWTKRLCYIDELSADDVDWLLGMGDIRPEWTPLSGY